jgi:hypothetical protein
MWGFVSVLMAFIRKGRSDFHVVLYVLFRGPAIHECHFCFISKNSDIIVSIKAAEHGHQAYSVSHLCGLIPEFGPI